MRSGVQTLRAIEALCAITGNYDVRGGMLPHAQPSVEERVLHEFVAAVQCNVPHESARGSRRYPLFAHFSRQCQLSDLNRQIRQGSPYPIRALCSFGLNINGYPNNKAGRLRWSPWTFCGYRPVSDPTAKYADIVLPACSSFEREMLHTTPEQRIYYTPPVIAPGPVPRRSGHHLRSGPAAWRRRIRCCAAAPQRCTIIGFPRWTCLWISCAMRTSQSSWPRRIPSRQLYLCRLPHPRRYELRSGLMLQMGYSALPEYEPPRSDAEIREFLLSSQ